MVKIFPFISILSASKFLLLHQYVNNSTKILKRSMETYMQAAAAELVTIVDSSNNVIGAKTRAEMRAEKLIHRATYAFVKNSSNFFYVQKRSKYKDYCPSYFDPTPGGVVAYDESFEETNRREVEEEMGIPATTPMTHLFTFYYEDERIKCFGDAWELTYDGELKLQVEEVESIHMMTMEEILERFEKGENFTPDSIYACKEYVRLFGFPEIKLDK